MGRITTGIGLVSGINSKDIIDQLMALEARPKDLLQTRIDSITQQRLAYTDLTTQLAGLKLSGTILKKPSTFQNATTSSSNENVLTATASSGSAVGSYQFQVARLVTTQQGVSRGFADFDSAKIGAGTITIEQGGGEMTRQDTLSELRGGAGVRRGLFRITDRGGATAIIDTTAAVTLDDVIKKINTNLDISVRASVDGDKIVLTDLTGKVTSNLIVQDVGDGHAGEDLGIVANVAANSSTGTDINYLGTLTSLTQLNDGRGVRTAASGADFAVTLADGSTVNVTLAGKKTVGDVIDAINTAGAGKLTAEIVAGANGIRLNDLSGAPGTFGVSALNNSKAAVDLGIEVTGATGTIDGSEVLSGLGTVLISTLNGGQGFALGTINIQSRAAGAGMDIDLSGAKTVSDVLDTINNAGAGVKAALNASGNGIDITDTSGGTGDLIIGDTTGTTATDFGLIGTFGTTTAAVKGANLQRQWVSENTLLADYNGGKGVSPGKFKITNSAGVSATIDLTQGNEIRLADVISEINSKGIGITASINAHGDGLLLTDTAGGANLLTVADLEGSTAADLNIKGKAATGATTIDGSFEKTLTITANDTLQDVQKKITDLNFGVTASIINDGSGLAPFRLAINAKNSGRDGRIAFDGGATTLETRTLVEAQDAAVFVGGASADQPLLITASKNQITGVVKGVNIDLHGVSDGPVTLNVTRNIDNVVTEIQKFSDGFNTLVDKITDLTKFDTDTNSRGLLLGELTVQQVQVELYNALSTVNVNAGRYRTFGDVGITVGDGARVTFDEDKFREAYGTDPDAVQKLFTELDSVTSDDGTSSVPKGLGYFIESHITKLIDPVNGVITRENKELDGRTAQFQDRIDSLDKLLDQKRSRLERQFANLESVLSGLQSQQQAIGQIKSISPTGN